MLSKIYTWGFYILLIFLSGYLINIGFPLLFSSLFTFLGSFFVVGVMNLAAVKIMNRSKKSSVVKDGFMDMVSHNKLYRILFLAAIWISQLSIVANYFAKKGISSDAGLLILLISVILSGSVFHKDSIE